MLEFLKECDAFEWAKRVYGEEVTVLGLPGYAVPKMHGGLPYCGNGLPEGFRDKKKILQAWLGNAISHQFHDFLPKKPVSIVLFTWVMADGLGDFSAQLSMAKRIEMAFPEAKISLITLMSRKEKRKISPGSFDSTILYYDNQEEVTFPEGVFDKMAKCTLLLHAPTFYPHWNNLEKRLAKGPRIVNLGQYGFINSEWYHPSSDNLCMGVHPLEKGLLLEDRVEAKILPNTYFAYFLTPRGAATYLHALLSSKKEEPKDLYLHVSFLLPLLKALETESLAGYGLSSIVIFDETRRAERSLAAEGKKLFLVSLRDLSPRAVQMEMAKSENFVGCRGDRSFSEVVSQGKFFFYDAPNHAIPFLMDLYNLAKHSLPFHFSLHEYLKTLFDRKTEPRLLGEKIADLMLDPGLFRGMEIFLHLLKRDFSFEDPLIHLVRMQLCYQENPLLEQRNSSYFDKWFEEGLPIKDLLCFFSKK